MLTASLNCNYAVTSNVKISLEIIINICEYWAILNRVSFVSLHNIYMLKSLSVLCLVILHHWKQASKEEKDLILAEYPSGADANTAFRYDNGK